jgi:tripartite-type tricarboxylate transporter receptor subunit TctC
MKLPHRRRFLHLAAGAAALPVVPRVAKAQAFPTRPITIVVPFAAGGALDVLGRILAERMRTSLGQSIIIENVAGANGSIGVGRVARAAPDGHTIVIGYWGTHVANGALYALPYDVLRDFEPISLTVHPHGDRLEERGSGEEFAGIDRVAKGQPGQGFGGNRGRG